MDHSWHPRPPPIQGNNNICPTCSISHFPFCPLRHLSFNENPRFPPHVDSFSHRPPYDPFLDHRGPTVNLHSPFAGNLSDGFADRQNWHRSPSLDREPYAQFHGPSQIGDIHMVNGVYGDGFKRMRVNERDLGTFVGESIANSSKITWDDERRLKLIRDHGSVASDINVKSNPTRNFETNECQNSEISYFDSKGASFIPNLRSNTGKYKEENGLAFEQHYLLSDKNEELEKSQYCRDENSMAHFQDNRHSTRPTDEAVPYIGGGNQYNSNMGAFNQRPLVPQSVHYSNFDARNENYQDHHLQRIQRSDSGMNESQYLYPTNWHGSAGLSAPYNEQSSLIMDSQNPNNHLPGPYAQYRMQLNHDLNRLGQFGDSRQSGGVDDLSRYGRNEQGGYLPIPMGPNVGPTAHAFVNAQPPLPTSPPPPLPLEPQGPHYLEPLVSPSPPKTSSSLFPVQVTISSSADVPSSHSPVPEAYSVTQNYYTNKACQHAPAGFSSEEFQAHPVLSKKYLGENQTFPLRHLSSDKPKPVDASHIFKQPHRSNRPDRIVIILRGLPGSGKSYLAKMLRDLEVENGGDAPRIHSMDDYFMTEVEKAEESDASKSSSSARGKKRVMKKVMEYCYEPEMEEAYRSSMLKAFKKTLDEGVFSFIIVDDRNLRVADFAQFWATAKRSGYEVYLLEAVYKDPVGCAARNVHSFTQDDIQHMAGQWEEAPSLYLKLDIKPLLHGDHLEGIDIQEVDMDTEDADSAGGLSGPDDQNLKNGSVSHAEEFNDPSKDYDKRWYAEKGHSTEEVKELKKSKWSDDLDEEDDDARRTQGIRRGNSTALSGLIQAYSKEGKSVRWGDQVGNTGFSIGALKRENILSLVIGPGAGYNLKSNPLLEEETTSVVARYSAESKRQNIFQEQIRAEKESFKAVFDKRRHRISGLDLEDE
ncbi:hypothetical protein LguiA_028199 [Lonicera macranthoides]